MIALFALAVFALVTFYVYSLSRHVDLGLASLLLAELVHLALGPNSQVIGGIHIDALDAVSLCLLAAGIVRTAVSLRTINSTRLLAVGYLVLFAASLGRGFYANGILATANESRSFVGPLVATIYFLTAPTDEKSVRRYTLAYLSFGVALCVVAALAAVGLPLGMNAWTDSDAAAIDGRYLPATGAAALAVCGFISLAWLRYRRKGLQFQLAPIIFVSIAIYLRHRTVWVMVLAGAIALLPLDGRLFRRLLPAAMVASVAVAALAFYGGSVQGLADADRFSQSATSSETLQWRLNGWKELLFDEEQTPFTVIIGKSMGSGFWRIDPTSDRIIGVAPHSEYIQEFLRVGVVGEFLIVFLALNPLPTLWRMSKVDPSAVYPSTSAWAIVVLSTLVYGFTYGIEPHAYALIGIANAISLGIHSSPYEEMIDLSDDAEIDSSSLLPDSIQSAHANS